MPNTFFSTRHGLETLLRRLVIGNKQYSNIEQMVGTVTGIVSSESDPSRLQGVTVRTNDGEITLPAALVIGMSRVFLRIPLVAYSLHFRRLYRHNASWAKMATARWLWRSQWWRWPPASQDFLRPADSLF